MSTVAIIATKMPRQVDYTYNYNNANKEVIYYPKEIVACKIWYDGYPYIAEAPSEGILPNININFNCWDYVISGNRRQVNDFSSYMNTNDIQSILPKIFQDKLSFEKWVKDNFDAEYLYFLEDGYWKDNKFHFSKNWRWKKLNHFSNEHPGEIDYKIPDGYWNKILYKDGKLLI